MPCNYFKYPPDWFTRIRPAILERAGDQCEGSPAFPDCRAANYEPHPWTGIHVVLTIAHVDHDLGNNDPANLRAWCQRCHLNHAEQHRQSLAATRRRKSPQVDLVDELDKHSKNAG